MSKYSKKGCVMHYDGENLFIILDGVKIAKRGEPGTRHAKTWVPIEPGWTVRDNDTLTAIEVSFSDDQAQIQ
jgi:hypothetical protein